MDGIDKLQSWLAERYSFLTQEDYDLFRPFIFQRTLNRDEPLLEEGRCCREMTFVLSGAFRMFYISEGKEVNVSFFFENEFVIDSDSFFSQTPSRYAIRALEDTEIVSFSYDILMDAYNRSKNWERLGRLLAETYSGTTINRLEKLLFMDGRERYLHLMQTRPDIVNRVPLFHLASYLGMERESLSRIRNRISRK